MYWRIEDLPELQHLSDTERRKLLNDSVGRRFTLRLILKCCLIAIAIASGLAFAFIAGYANHPLQSVQPSVIIFVPTVSSMLGMLTYFVTLICIRGQIRTYLKQQKQQGESLPTCLKCGYAIVGDPARCPECGTAL